MKRGVLLLSLVFVVGLIFVSGCATTGTRRSSELANTREQLEEMEELLEERDNEIAALRQELGRLQGYILSQQRQAKQVLESQAATEVKSRPSVQQIQTALMNAGYNPGPIDGKLGNKTREAIRAFQKDHSLTVDGKVGNQTWAVLGEYLHKAVK